jgi:hypothetical protein
MDETDSKDIKAGGTAAAPRWLDSAVTFRKSTALKVSFILLAFFDLILTVVAMYVGLWEINPLVRFLVHVPLLLILIKLVIPVAAAWIMPGRLLWPCIIALGAVVVWNIWQLFAFAL